MPYARLDDRYDDHRKIMRAWRRSPAAVALHAMAITYCNRHCTDGLVESDWLMSKIDLMPARTAQRSAVLVVLLELRLLERVDDEHYLVHDFLDWNLSRKQRQTLGKQGRRGGLARSKGSSDGSSPPNGGGLSEGSSKGLSPGLEKAQARHATPIEEEANAPSSLSDAERADVKASDEDKQLCRLLTELARERNPKFKVRSKARWLTDMRLLRERDDNAPAEIEEAIRWVFLDDFWGGVIRSPGNLREHFPAIWDRMRRPLHAVPSVEDSAAFLARRGAA